ncbi:MAG TPA: MFS transporter [Gemmataceae bacterium]|nr:MFS transporter [Gemmataceae bacterium]
MNKPASSGQPRGLAASSAFSFVFTLGIVNLFADVTYEGGASINGPFMGMLGAGAAAISIVAGLGEFLGYSLRSVAGFIADKTGKYWPITFIGYSINLLAVPAMALTHHWQAAAIFVLAERVGRAIRKPTVEAMLSYSTGKLGRGWVYGFNSAMDETGATVGPLLLALVLFLKGSYRTGYGLLLISSLLAIASLAVARIIFPVPSRLEEGGKPTAYGSKFLPSYWLYMAAGACFAAGLMSFELVSYHMSKTGTVTEFWIPLFLAISTGFGVVANIVLGRLYDRVGLPIVLVAVVLTALFSPLVFLGGFYVVLVGMLLWGIGYATQDTLLKAILAGHLPEGKRNLAFGLFYTGYGCGWLIGSVSTGLLYDRSIALVIAFSVAIQLASLPLFILAARSEASQNRPRSAAQ